MTLALDRSVGMVLDELEKHSLTDNTLIFFVNDNGGVAGHDNKPLRGFKGSTWEGGIRVPFAIQWPAALPKGKVIEAPVISLDIFPTAMAAAGLVKSPGQPLDGLDLLPYMQGKAQDWPHRTLYWKNGDKWAVRDGNLKAVSGNVSTMVRRGKNAQKGEPSTEILLFDLASDISESKDVAASHPEDVVRLKKLYAEWKKDFPAPSWGPGKKKE